MIRGENVVKVCEKPEGSGKWVVVMEHGGNLKERVCGSRAEAEALAAELARRLGNGQSPKQAIPTLGTYSRKWLSGIRTSVGESTYERYSGLLEKYVLPSRLASGRLDRITRGDVRDFLSDAYGEGLSKSSVALLREVVSGIMGYAVEDELVPANPTDGILRRMRMEREKGRDSKADPMRKEEVGLFLDTCLEAFPEHHPFFLCAFRTGMRLGEIIALRWSDIDRENRLIRVERSFRREREGPTKTGATRHIDISDQLHESLESLRKKKGREGLVFHRNGRHHSQNSVRKRFKSVLRRAGMRHFRFHDVRHTFASLLLGQGVSIVYVKEQLGHRNIQMTVDTYGRLIPGTGERHVNLLDG